jgi:uncharacterized protein YbjT (DUF2867 family)
MPTNVRPSSAATTASITRPPLPRARVYKGKKGRSPDHKSPPNHFLSYDATGPEAITLHEAAEELTRATGRRVTYPTEKCRAPKRKPVRRGWRMSSSH